MPVAARPLVWSVPAAAGRCPATRPGTARGPPPGWGVRPALVQARRPMTPRWGDQVVAQAVADVDGGGLRKIHSAAARRAFALLRRSRWRWLRSAHTSASRVGLGARINRRSKCDAVRRWRETRLALGTRPCGSLLRRLDKDMLEYNAV